MQVITLDGPSKTGKTCVGANLQEALVPEVDGPIRFGTAGDFFRRLTVAVIDQVGVEAPGPEMARELEKVIANEEAFDESRQWGDLQRPEVENLVSTIGPRPEVQVAGRQWFDQFPARALEDGVSLLIIDGRNPRRSLARALRHQDTDLILDLFMDCEVETAVGRLGLSKPEEVTRVAQLAKRRQNDSSFFRYPRPEDTVQFEPMAQDTTRDVVRAARDHAEPPATIYLDTTPLNLAQVYDVTTRLARSALALV